MNENMKTLEISKDSSTLSLEYKSFFFCGILQVLKKGKGNFLFGQDSSLKIFHKNHQKFTLFRFYQMSFFCQFS